MIQAMPMLYLLLFCWVWFVNLYNTRNKLNHEAVIVPIFQVLVLGSGFSSFCFTILLSSRERGKPMIWNLFFSVSRNIWFRKLLVQKTVFFVIVPFFRLRFCFGFGFLFYWCLKFDFGFFVYFFRFRFLLLFFKVLSTPVIVPFSPVLVLGWILKILFRCFSISTGFFYFSVSVFIMFPVSALKSWLVPGSVNEALLMNWTIALFSLSDFKNPHQLNFFFL